MYNHQQNQELLLERTTLANLGGVEGTGTRTFSALFLPFSFPCFICKTFTFALQQETQLILKILCIFVCILEYKIFCIIRAEFRFCCLESKNFMREQDPQPKRVILVLVAPVLPSPSYCPSTYSSPYVISLHTGTIHQML